MDTRKLKDRAAQALAKGKVDKAIELYEELVRADPRDLQLKVRLGDVYRRAGRTELAIDTYRAVVDRYARDGLLLKAIAVCKIVLEVDATHQATQQLLADLYARKYGKSGAPQPAGALAGVPIPLDQPVRPDAIDLDEPELPPDAPVPIEGRVEVRGERDESIGERASTAAPELLLDDAGGLPPELTLDLEATVEEPDAEAAGMAASPPETEVELEIVEGEEIDLEGALSAAAAAVEPDAGSGEPDDPWRAAPAAPPQPPAGKAAAPPPPAAPALDPDALPQIPLFSELGKAAFIQLLETCELQDLPARTLVIEQGTPGTSFFVVVSGGVRVVREEESGATTELATLGEGAFFGEMALLSGGARVASVTTTGPTQLLEFGKKAMDQLVRDHPSVDGVLRKFARQRLLANVMATSPLFRPFDRNDRKLLIEKFRSRELERGEVVIAEGDAVDGLYVVLSGNVAVARKEGSRKVHLASLKEGDLFGEISLLTRQRATATCTARRRSTVLRLPKKTFDEVILTHPQILELVSDLTEERQQKTEAVLAGRLVVDEDGVMLV
jgi:CRP-like cAMP-binding protein